jgi:hypothetical protein
LCKNKEYQVKLIVLCRNRTKRIGGGNIEESKMKNKELLEKAGPITPKRYG